jgi:hypothetical protein
MKLKYLKTAEAGLRWFASYYRHNPQLNTKKAVVALRAAEAALLEYPMIGTKLEGEGIDDMFQVSESHMNFHFFQR